MGEKGEHFPKVSITNEDIARIAIAVKDILKLDIETTVEKTIIEKQQPLLEKIESLERKKHELETKCKLLEEIKDIKDENKKIHNKCDALEIHSRKTLLRFSGVTFSSGENTSSKVVDIVKQIGIEMKVADIEVSHRTGNSTPDRPRQIIARIRNYELKFKILKSAKNLRTTDGLKNFSINQDLTKSRDELAFMARQYVRKKSTWVIDGKVYVTTNGDKKYVFRRMKDVNAIMKKGKLNSEMIWKMRKKSKLKCEMIWKIWKKSKLECDMIWKIWKKGKSNSEKIGEIWKKIVKGYEKYGKNPS